MIKKYLLFIVGLLFSCTFVFGKPKATLTQTSDRFFWEISGKDSNGEDSKVYIQGTIHVGSEDLYPLSENVLTAFNSANRHVSEISTEDLANLVPETQNEMLTSLNNAEGRKVSDYLSEEEMNLLREAFSNLGGEETLNALTAMEPWVLNSALTGVTISACNYDVNYGLDFWFYAQLAKANKSWEGLDSLKTQMDIVRFGDYDEQLLILKETLNQILKIEETSKEFDNLYKAYLDNNPEELLKIIEEETDKELKANKKFYKKYNNKIFIERNKAWAKKIDQYLQEGGTTFIFAGCAHFLGKDSVFTYLKKNKTIK